MYYKSIIPLAFVIVLELIPMKRMHDYTGAKIDQVDETLAS